MTEEEVWKPMFGYEGYYEVSSQGGVRGVERIVKRKDRPQPKHAKTKAQFKSRDGYWSVTLCKDGELKAFKTHKLIAMTFLGPVPPGLEVCHRDDEKLDNRVSNLYYATHAQNMVDRSKNGKTAMGEKSGGAKLTTRKVLEIKAFWPSLSMPELSRMYGVSTTAIWAIVHHRKWKHVG